MFLCARNAAGLSREEAIERLGIGSHKTLYNYEFGFTTVPADIVLLMQQVYHDPTMAAKYCSDHCPIGKVFAHNVNNTELCRAVVGLVKEEKDVYRIHDDLMAITEDGIISPDEAGTFKRVMSELLDLEKKIEEIKLAAAPFISIPEIMLEKKRPLEAAR